MASGYLETSNGRQVYFDYNIGAVSLDYKGKFPAMPIKTLENSPISWWIFALEMHTGRIFQFLIGDFYILIVPLMGIFGTLLVISGLVVWIKLYVRKNR